MSSIIFKTSRLIIKPFSIKDLKCIHEMNSQEEVARYNTIGIPKDINETKQLLSKVLDENNVYSKGFSIRLNTSGEFIGELGLSLSSQKFSMAEIHYSLVPEFWGNGLATEAVEGLLNYCFTVLNLHRIEAGVATENLASIKVLEKVGMTREGRKRKVLPIRGQWVDNYHYAILEEDYLQK